MNFRAIRHFSTSSPIQPLAEAVIQLPRFLEFYRPVISTTEHIIESIVSYTGMPWWLSISMLTLSIRLSNLPLLYLQYRAMRPLATAMPSYRLLFDVSKHSTATPLQKLSCIWTSSRSINSTHETRFFKSFAYGFLQVPQFLTFVWSVRALCVENEALKTGGVLWFEDLSQTDPLMILPVVSIGLTYVNLQMGVTKENKDWLINRFKNYLQIWIILTLPISVNWPSVKVIREFFAIGSRIRFALMYRLERFIRRMLCSGSTRRLRNSLRKSLRRVSIRRPRKDSRS